MKVDPLIATNDPTDPTNSTGKEIVDTVNTLAFITSANVDHTVPPELDLSVTTHVSIQEGFGYKFGDQIRTNVGFFRCIKDVDPTAPATLLFDKQHWSLFWMPSTAPAGFMGQYNSANEYQMGSVVYIESVDDIKIAKTKEFLAAGTAYDENLFEILHVILR